jgi:hypothetical protein
MVLLRCFVRCPLSVLWCLVPLGAFVLPAILAEDGGCRYSVPLGFARVLPITASSPGCSVCCSEYQDDRIGPGEPFRLAARVDWLASEISTRHER